MGGRTRAGLLAILATSCTRPPLPSVVCGDGTCGSQTTVTKVLQQSANRTLDMVFVTDDTSDVAPWQDNLRAGYPEMARVLEDLQYGIPNLHIGFVRASRCAPQTRARDCGIAESESFLRHEGCGTISNFSGSFADTFACLADFGTDACAPAQPFQALRDVLAQPPPPGWQGFLRPDAYLMIVVIAGRDDASNARVADLVAFIRALKGDPASQILVSLIGPGGECTTEGQPPRLVELVQQFGGNGNSLGLCHDPTGALGQLRGGDIDIQPPCIGPVLDVDPSTPGLQPECTVEDTVLAPDTLKRTTLLPACDVAPPPCWQLLERLDGCTGVHIVRAADWCIETATTTRIECLRAAN